MCINRSVGKEKLFRDSVHGYIKVPVRFCADFVDTPLFQRLRRIEQTSMRVLYPSAHHDRFIHSLGVYHLGKLAVRSLRQSAEERWKEFSTDSVSTDLWKRYTTTFEVACLLHDCGHAPFSHTLEEQYDPKDRGNGNAAKSKLDAELIALTESDGVFRQDFESCLAAPHEKTSAILVLTEFKDRIKQHDCDPLLVARMILGCLHHSTSQPDFSLDSTEKLENCLIQLLNGKAIDVDKLDYILRDTWASGVDNVAVDVDRLLGALIVTKIDDDFPKLAFGSRALSVLQSAVDARNYLYQWIYSHHKVLYDAELLKRAVEALGKSEDESNGLGDSLLSELFSTRAFREPIKINGMEWYLPTDDDVVSLLKQYHKEIPEVKEWLFRQHSRVPLWKTVAEFHDIFQRKPETERVTIGNNLEDILEAFCLKKGFPRDAFLSARAPVKRTVIERNQIFVEVRGRPVSYSDVFGEEKKQVPTYFLVYGDRTLLHSKVQAECVDFLLSQS